jgi:hypothetical protein
MKRRGSSAAWSVLLVLATAFAPAGADPNELASADRAFLGFCADLSAAKEVLAEGPAGDTLLEACVFGKGGPSCAPDLGIDAATLRRLRRRKAFFVIAGNPMMGGYRLEPSDRWQKAIARTDPDGPYAELLRLRRDLTQAADLLRQGDFLEESHRREQAGGSPLQWGGSRPHIEAKDLDRLRIEYVVRLKAQQASAQHAQLAACLGQELAQHLPAYAQTEEGRLRTRLESDAASLASELRQRFAFTRAWRSLVLPKTAPPGNQGPAAVVVRFEDRTQPMFAESKDRRSRIFPWFELRLLAAADVREQTPGPEQPVTAVEPDDDRRELKHLGAYRGNRLFFREGTLPSFRKDSEVLVEWLRQRCDLGTGSPL